MNLEVVTTDRAWYGMEWKFRYGIWKMLFLEWNGRQSSILP